MSDPFVGKSLALTTDGVSESSGSLGVDVATLWSVLAVETSGCGFLPDRRPQILFERHLFHRLTAGRFDDGDISDPTPGGYGAQGAHQYDRLARAMAKDQRAALQSASWGLGQVLGTNFAPAGFTSVEAMVQAMVDSEDAQLRAVASFIDATDLAEPLQAQDWAGFAAGYNGPAFAKNHYDVQLGAEFLKFSAGALPDLTVRAAQLYLTYRGFHPGPVDGVLGNLTRSALREFQKQHGLALTGAADAQTLEALQPS